MLLDCFIVCYPWGLNSIGHSQLVIKLSLRVMWLCRAEQLPAGRESHLRPTMPHTHPAPFHMAGQEQWLPLIMMPHPDQLCKDVGHARVNWSEHAGRLLGLRQISTTRHTRSSGSKAVA